MKKHYIYAHANESGIFYVGCATSDFKRRGVKGKRQRAYSKSGHTPAWHAAAAEGYTVAIVFETDDRVEAFLKEIELIARFRSQGHAMVNIAIGGPGVKGLKDGEETRRKKSVTKIGALNPMHGITGAAHPNSRRVRDAATGATYDSVLIAAEARGFKMKTLYNWLSGHRPNPTTLEFAP